MRSPVDPARALFVAHGLACVVLSVLCTGGGCGPTTTPLPSTNVQCHDGGVPGAVPPDPKKPFVWLGTTDSTGAFSALTPDETLAVQHGPQGGTHVWGAARLYTPVGGTWTLGFALKDASATELASVAEVVEGCAGGVVEATDVTVFLHVAAPTAGVLSVDATPAGASSAASHAESPIKVQ